MAKVKPATRKKITRKQVAHVVKVAGALWMDVPPNCQDLFAAQEAIAQLLIENNCLPLAKPNAKKKA